MQRCPYLKYGFDIVGHTLVKCEVNNEPEKCPRKHNKPPEYPISQSCWKVEID